MSKLFLLMIFALMFIALAEAGCLPAGSKCAFFGSQKCCKGACAPYIGLQGVCVN